jgi:hypothetical protein
VPREEILVEPIRHKFKQCRTWHSMLQVMTAAVATGAAGVSTATMATVAAIVAAVAGAGVASVSALSKTHPGMTTASSLSTLMMP